MAILNFRAGRSDGDVPPGGTIAALDIGTSKVACFIARIADDGALHITGVGHQLSKGMRSGVIVDAGEAETSILAAVHAAEQMAGQTIESIAVNISNSQLHSRIVTVEMALTDAAVGDREIVELIREGKQSIMQPDMAILHCLPVCYWLDNNRGISDPRGMIGENMGADLHMVSVPMNLLRNLTQCIARCHLNVSEFVLSSHASGLACLDPDEMKLGVTVIDMGSGVTSFSVFCGGKNLYSATLPVGGLHVTSDIAKGLSTSMAHAERIKTLHGSAISSPSDDQGMIEVPQLGEDDDEGAMMPRSMLVGIIRPRLEEIFEMVRGKIEATGLDKVSGRRVVLTGGASQMLGIRDMASRVLGKQVRVGKPHSINGLADSVSGSAFSTPIGMLEYIRHRGWEEHLLHPSGNRVFLGRRFDKMVHWVKENF